MTPESLPGPSVYRVTLFFGPEPVEGRSDIQACVFNVKKRNWKAGIHVSVEVGHDQLSRLLYRLQVSDRLTRAFMTLAPDERQACQARVPDLFAQVVAWCKLDLGLEAGLAQEHQCIPSGKFVSELDQSVGDRAEYVVAYILSELDVVPDCPSS